MERARIEEDLFDFTTGVETFSSGCELLDCVLGGGYPVGRVVNVVGDKSSGKTLLAIEACANFAAKYPDGVIRYREVEAAFDPKYAQALGLPLSRVEFPASICETVEDMYEDIVSFIATTKMARGLYILDSLDALSDKAELEGDFGEASFGVKKAKLMSQLFRRITQAAAKSNVTILIVSQIRDNVGVVFGKATTRSGGRALDFYSSQVLFLKHIKTMVKTIDKIERPIGVLIRIKCEKNKIGLPFRECQVPIIFGYGVDDIAAGVDWLLEIGKESELDLNGQASCTAFFKRVKKGNREERLAIRGLVAETVNKVWKEVESKFYPDLSKY